MPELKKYLFDNFVVEPEDRKKIPEPKAVAEAPSEMVIEPEEIEKV